MSTATGAGGAQDAVAEDLSFESLLASLGTGAALFGVQFLIFNILRLRLKRVYEPKTYMVPEKERVPEPKTGIFGWVISIFTTSNTAFIEKCGLDAYFFLRYLRMLLKIFLPLALFFLPILLPVNSLRLFGGGAKQGVNRYSISNIPDQNANRLWVHCVAIICMDIWIAIVMFSELRGYIRIRQAYLTSPQHRLRASATTVLIANISRKWLTKEALDGLFDVFPGGVRNIWINRNYDELDALVNARDALARNLENLYSNLLAKAQKRHRKEREKSYQGTDLDQEIGARPGMSTGNPHQIAQNLDEALGRQAPSSPEAKMHEENKKIPIFSDVAAGFGAVGQGIGEGFGAVGHGMNRFGNLVKGGVVDTFGLSKREQRAGAPHGDQATDSRNETIDNSPSSEKTMQGVDGANDTVLPDSRTRGDLDRQASTTFPDNRTSGASNEFRAVPARREPEADVKLPKRGVSRRFHRDDLKSKFPSPQPKAHEGDEYPLTDLTPAAHRHTSSDSATEPSSDAARVKSPAKTPPESSWWSPVKGVFVNSLEEEMPTRPELLQLAKAETLRRQALLDEVRPKWTRLLKESDRDTTTVHSSVWLNWIPYVGQNIDTIDYRTVKLAVYNQRIEELQKDPERFPLMNSAFIQFNHQVAAHMACQSVAHHVPLQMNPRTVEISPDDVQWDNLSTPWWSRYIRTTLVYAAVVGLIIAWAAPIAFTGGLSQISNVAATTSWLRWLADLPDWVQSILQGVLPPALLALLLVLLPILLRLLTSFQGMQTGTDIELNVQGYYFVFLFIQVFLVVSISSGLTALLELFQNPENFASVPQTLAENLPDAANYFFSYIILQALSVSAGAVLQGATLFFLFLWSKMVDSSPRAYFNRATTLPTIQWGTFFPVYTNFAVIGIVYAPIAPLILVFLIVTYSLFWFVHRYNALYVNRYTNDTGGLLFPRAVLQLFFGLYTMHICLFGLFLLKGTAIPQAVIVAVCAVLLIIFQYNVKRQFEHLYRYIPITMEDEAVERDEEFAALQARRHDGDMGPGIGKVENLQHALLDQERKEDEESRALEAEDKARIEQHKREESTDRFDMDGSFSHTGSPSRPIKRTSESPNPNHDRDSSQHSQGRRGSNWASKSRTPKEHQKAWAVPKPTIPGLNLDDAALSLPLRRAHKSHEDTEKADVEAQKPISERFYHGISDELEDLTREERDILVDKAFVHRAMRATRPAVWIPKDSAGVSEFEIRVIDSSDELRRFIWISDEGAGFDRRGKVDLKRMRRPPDFNEERLIKL